MMVGGETWEVMIGERRVAVEEKVVLTRCDTVNTYASFLKLSRHEFGQMHSATLGGIVREVPLCVAHDAGHAADHDDVAEHVATLLCRLLE